MQCDHVAKIVYSNLFALTQVILQWTQSPIREMGTDIKHTVATACISYIATVFPRLIPHPRLVPQCGSYYSNTNNIEFNVYFNSNTPSNNTA